MKFVKRLRMRLCLSNWLDAFYTAINYNTNGLN